MRTRFSLAAGLAVALALAAAAPATATRYVSPTGSNTDPTCAAAAPCSLARALAVSGAEEIVLAQGDYHVKAPSTIPCTGVFEPSVTVGSAVPIGNRYVHGEPGRPRPRLIGDANACVVLNVAGAGRAEHIEVIGTNTAKSEAAAVLIDGAGNAADLITGGPNGTVHMRNGAKLLNSVAGARPQDGAAVFLHFGFNLSAGFITNVTALGDVVADSPNVGFEVDAEIVCVNSIATGRFLARQTNAVAGSTARITRDRCAGPAQTSGGPNVILNNVGPNLAGATLVPGDYHQAPTSPTINAGRVDPAILPLTDIDGGARVVGPNPDIGADEFGAASALVDSGAVQSVAGSSAVIAGTVFPGGLPTAAYVEYGPTTGYGSQTAAAGAGSSFGAVPLSFTLSGMTVNSPVYHYRLVGTNGGSRGEDRVIALADADADGWYSNTDCNDGNGAIRPGRDDVPDNGVDDDCDGADAVNLDRDADGYPRPLDCNDGTAAINPGRTDVPGNGIDEDCKNGDAAFPVLTSTVGFGTRAYVRYTHFTDLFVRRARSGSTILVRCTGGGCPFKSKRVQVKRDADKLSLRSLLRGKRLKPGARVRVTITFPQTVGVDTTLTVRANRKNPSRKDACLLPGATKSSRCVS